MFHMQFVLDFNKHLIKIDFFSSSALANSIYLAASHTASSAERNFQAKGVEGGPRQMINLGSNKARILVVFKDTHCIFRCRCLALWGYRDGEHDAG